MADIVPPKGYKLVWHDEFDQGTEPNLNEWYYEEFPPFKVNNESQAYVAGWKDNEQLAVVSEGILSIFAKNIAGQVYSIRMNTKRNWTYGYFEAGIKVPSGRGTWPAFWMLPSNFVQWPLDGEIDIMEYVGYERDIIHASIHCQAYNHVNKTHKTNRIKVENAETDWHTYACEWTRNYIQMFVDGKPYFYFENDHKNNKETWPFDAPFYIKLNLAWGGMWGGKYGMDESALPAQYQIDYVRVFQRTNEDLPGEQEVEPVEVKEEKKPDEEVKQPVEENKPEEKPAEEVKVEEEPKVEEKPAEEVKSEEVKVEEVKDE